MKGAAMTAGVGAAAGGAYVGGRMADRKIRAAGGYKAVGNQARDYVGGQMQRAGGAVRSGASRAGAAINQASAPVRGAAESAGRFASTKVDEARVKGRSLYQRGIQSGGQKVRDGRAFLKRGARKAGFGKVAKFLSIDPKMQRRIINLEAVLDEALGLD